MKLPFCKPQRNIVGMEVDLSPMYPKTAKTNVIKGRRLDVWVTTKLYYHDGTMEQYPGQSWVKFDNQPPKVQSERDQKP